MIKSIKKLNFWIPVFAVSFLLGLSGCSSYYATPYPVTYPTGYVNVGAATPSFAFSVGYGVNAYYYSPLQTYLYLYNGRYYRWFNNGWVYAQGYTGPWYSIGIGIPAPLIYGPPIPMGTYQPYFTWWRTNVSPWYRTHYPNWWTKHNTYLNNYNSWQRHVTPYRNHPENMFSKKERMAPQGKPQKNRQNHGYFNGN